MKILIVDYCVDLVGGVERTINTIANDFSSWAEVDVLSETKIRRESFYRYNSAVRKDYLFDFSARSSISFCQKVYRKAMLPLKIISYLKKHNSVDVIIFGRVYVALHFLPLLKFAFKKKPKIIVRDAIHVFSFTEKDKHLMKKLFPKCVDTFIVSSDESARTYRDFFGESSIAIVKMYNPLGIKPVVGYSFESKTVVSIGRMDDDQKGFTNLIRAFAIVHDSHPDWRLELYGDGHAKPELIKLIDSVGAKSYISIFNSTKDVASIFNKSSIFVLASRYEGYANILVEALACGVPSISYNWLMGVDEIIKNKKNGLIVKLRNRRAYVEGYNNDEDIVALGKAINLFIEKRNLAENCSKEGAKIVESRSLDLIMNKWREIVS